MLSEYAIRNCIFGIKCEADWEKMIVIQSHDEDEQTTSEIRFCKSCQKEVYQCDYDETLLESIHLNRCIRIAATPWFPPLMGYVISDSEK
jgi:hypothetical protein